MLTGSSSILYTLPPAQYSIISIFARPWLYNQSINQSINQSVTYWHQPHSMQSRGYTQLSGVRLSAGLFHPAAARRYGGFTPVGPATRIYRSIAVRLASRRSTATAPQQQRPVGE